jgi:polyisoprenyl-teichoic acid--peptidoglycan teichoic acid transferase
MYGDNNNLILVGIGLILVLFLGSLTVVSFVKINRLEDQLVSSVSSDVKEEKSAKNDTPSRPKTENKKVEEDSSFYQSLEIWEERKEKKSEYQNLSKEIRGDQWDFLKELDLHLIESSSLFNWTIESLKEENLVFSLNYSDETWLLSSPREERFTFTKVNRKVENFLREESETWLTERNERAEAVKILMDIASDSRTTNLLHRKKCHLSETKDGSDLTAITVLTLSENRPVLSLRLEGSNLYLEDEIFQGDRDSFLQSFYDQLTQADTRVEEDILLSQALEQIRNLYCEKDFLDRLSRLNLKPILLEREDQDFVYMDLVAEGTDDVKASFAVKKYTGRIYFMDENDVALAALDSLKGKEASLPDNLADLEPAFEEGDSFNVLLVGYHNKGTDTMILAHIDQSAKSVSLISIPRDLWWEGQKLNAYYFGSGKEDFLNLMTKLTGVKVDYYLAVDMYAFIDVINAMGGIDLTLEKEVRDPTYKIIREDGTEGTLYYPPGDYHLAGVEALRLVRSRHGSSDFERSLLQQKVLSASKERAGELSLKDMDTFLRFVKIAGDQTQTNMSLPFIVKSFLAMKDFSLEGGHNLNDKSLIYNTYSNYLGLSSVELSRAKGNKDYPRGQWILLPVEGDWNLIKLRIREIIQG